MTTALTEGNEQLQLLSGEVGTKEGREEKERGGSSKEDGEREDESREGREKRGWRTEGAREKSN